MQEYIDIIDKFLEEAKKATKDLTFYEKFEFMLKNNRISISTIQRIFNYSFPRAEKIIQDLIDCKAIQKQGKIYVVLSEDKYYDYVKEIAVDNNTLDKNGDLLIKSWIAFDFYKRATSILDFEITKFKKLIKDTILYFQKLNAMESIVIGSKEDISLHSCMRIVSSINFYSSNKTIDADCDYNNYEDLENYPLVKQQITIKATQLIAESLAREISFIPKKQLSEVIGVVYNGTTIDYNAELGNIEDIVKAVSECPYSEN